MSDTDDNLDLTPGIPGGELATDYLNSAHYQIVKTAYGIDGEVVTVSDANPMPITNHQDEISLGHVTGVKQCNNFAYRDQSTAAGGEETIWASNDNLVIMKTAETFDITYNSTTDGAAGGATGAKQLTIYYLDASKNHAIAVHNLGSDGSDTTSFTGLGINRVVVSSSGTSDVNVNDITITNTTSGNTQAVIPALGGVTQQAIFFIGDNQKAIAKWLLLVANKLSGSNPKITFKGYVWNRGIETRFEIFRYVMDTQSENVHNIIDPCNFPLSPGDVIYFVMDTDQNNTVAGCRFSLNVYDF